MIAAHQAQTRIPNEEQCLRKKASNSSHRCINCGAAARGPATRLASNANSDRDGKSTFDIRPYSPCHANRHLARIRRTSSNTMPAGSMTSVTSSSSKLRAGIGIHPGMHQRKRKPCTRHRCAWPKPGTKWSTKCGFPTEVQLYKKPGGAFEPGKLPSQVLRPFKGVEFQTGGRPPTGVWSQPSLPPLPGQASRTFQKISF